MAGRIILMAISTRMQGGSRYHVRWSPAVGTGGRHRGSRPLPTPWPKCAWITWRRWGRVRIEPRPSIFASNVSMGSKRTRVMLRFMIFLCRWAGFLRHVKIRWAFFIYALIFKLFFIHALISFKKFLIIECWIYLLLLGHVTHVIQFFFNWDPGMCPLILGR